MQPSPLTVEITVDAPLAHVWACWTEPTHIVQWAFASDDWEAPAAENDVRVGGRFKTVMAAKDRSASFDFCGTYTVVVPQHELAYDMDDGRHVLVLFSPQGTSVHITETFDPESQNPLEMQRAGWQAFLQNFKRHAEATKPA
jgi:uncharacterized protein YndB with AHSA1/START domain